jgi:hypothetical protein
MISPPATETPKTGLWVFMLGGINVVLLTVLTLWVLLKEQPLFWQNAGGWPVVIRDWVKAAFYPLLIAELMALLGFSRTGLRRRNSSGKLAAAGIALTLLFWLGFLLVAGLLFSNNLDNFLHGRPLHWHAE